MPYLICKIIKNNFWDELQAYSVKSKSDQTRINGENTARMDQDRQPRAIISYNPRGRSLQRRPRKTCFP
jgi:hypothetical protein